ncbi:phosphotransferase family protein [Paenibacillus sp. sgz500958]|uniref:phosphotransferase family protein n=1 Tax=Paenibacillus sp. sgz500958 TaxID=3242475 RepID=UPI0036D2A219
MDAIAQVPGYEDWKIAEPVLKGWSDDKKYYIEDRLGRKLLLRLADSKKYAAKEAEYEFIQRMNQLAFPMSRAVDFGLTRGGQNVYMLLTWVEGVSLHECIHSLPEARQYELGIEAGKILKQMHSVPHSGDDPVWGNWMKNRILSRVEQYESCPYRVHGDERVIAYVRDNISQLDHVKQVYRHGDFHIGNLIYTAEGGIGVIDFNRCDSGDYVEDFYKVQMFDREHSIAFAKGKIEGYFEGSPPVEFWRRHALYVAYSALYSIIWAIPFGPSDVEGMIERYQTAFTDYDDFTRIIPRWYAESL